MDIFLLYLLMQADSIIVIALIIAILSASTVGVLQLYLIDSSSNTAKALRKKGITFCVFSVAILAFFPSTKTLAVMFGVHYAIEAAKSETGKKIQKLVNDTLDKAIEKIND